MSLVTPSSLGGWSDCELRQHRNARTESGRFTAAQLVGVTLHDAIAAGGSYEIETDRQVAWDDITEDTLTAAVQVRKQYLALDRWMVENNVRVKEKEFPVHGSVGGVPVSGKVDMLALYGKDSVPALIDVKTGRWSPHVMLQLGLYSALIRDEFDSWDPSERTHTETFERGFCHEGVLIAISLPRARPGKEQELKADIRPALFVEDRAREIAERAVEVATEKSHPIARPGWHCQSCELDDCAVRAPERA